MSGCAIDAEVIKGYDACINDDKIVDALASAFEGTLGPESYYFMKEPLGFSEDYSFFGSMTGKPSVLMFLNAGHALGMEVSTLHSPDCTFDEAAMQHGMARDDPQRPCTSEKNDVIRYCYLYIEKI